MHHDGNFVPLNVGLKIAEKLNLVLGFGWRSGLPLR